jgi:glycosyltransferase involved in cell wall biosynthesis
MSRLTTPPSVTVIIPTFNWSGVLPYCVGSVLRQTFQDFEVLVIGDGCTDDSETVINMIGDARVRWFNLPENTGHQSGPNNEGLRQARGEFIAYLGHDDLWLPHHLACLVAALATGADVAYALTLMVGPGGCDTGPAPRRQSYQPGMWIPPTGLMHRRRVTDDVGGWRQHRELKVDPEVDLWRRAHAAGHRFVFVPRLTAVKFPAARRRDIYKSRPHDEQAAWLQRIEAEGEFEVVELAKMLGAATQAQLLWGEAAYSDLVRGVFRETARRVRRLLLMRKGEHVEAHRQFKGLEPRLEVRK